MFLGELGMWNGQPKGPLPERVRKPLIGRDKCSARLRVFKVALFPVSNNIYGDCKSAFSDNSIQIPSISSHAIYRSEWLCVRMYVNT